MIDSARTGRRGLHPSSFRLHPSKVISDEAISRLRPRGKQTLAPFEKPRGVTDVAAKGSYTYLMVALDGPGPRAARELDVYRTLSGRRVSINLVKLHEHG